MWAEVAIGAALCWLVYILRARSSPTITLNMPGSKGWPFFGNVLEMMGDPLLTFQHYRSTFGPVFQYQYFMDPVVVVSEPELIKHVLQSPNYAKEQDQVIIDVIGNGLLLANGDFWRRQRKIMSPSFSTLYLKRLMPSFNLVMDQVTAHLDTLASTDNNNDTKDTHSNNSNSNTHNAESEGGAEIDMHALMTKITLDVIGLAGFGYEFHAVTDSTGLIPQAVTTVLTETESRIFDVVGLWRLPFLPRTRKFEKAKAVLLTEVDAMIRQRRKDEPSKLQQSKDLLGRMMAAQDPDTGETLSDFQLRDELITFLIAGHETTAASLAFTFYLIATHPDVERQVMEEIDRVIGDEPLTYEAIQQLTYLPLVMKESLRCYPSVAMQTTRVANEDDYIGTYFIPKGTSVEIWPWLVHRAEDLWGEDALQFRPDRWESMPSPGFKYIPFGGGPRDCIGQKLALLETKVVLVAILRRYTLRLDPAHSMSPVLSITLRPKDCYIRLHKRVQDKSQ